MFIKFYKTSKCVMGCNLFNDESDYLYWENKEVTTDEVEIVKFIKKDILNKDEIKILHIGVGNSFVAKELNFAKKIDGISISNNEIKHGKKIGIKNYNIFFLNKFTKNGFEQLNLNGYDLIIDVNLKSFSCCEGAFINLFQTYLGMLRGEGKIITAIKGMNWSRIVKPVMGFSIKKLLYKRLKEFDGPGSNILSIKQSEVLAKNYKLNLFYNNMICYFEKN